MLRWLLPLGSGSGSNPSRATECHNAQASIYYFYSVFIISLTLIVARLHNHIRFDLRHEQHSSSLYLRPILSTSLSSQHFHPQQQRRGWITMAIMAIPVLSKATQAAPTVGYSAIMNVNKRAYAAGVEHATSPNAEGDPTNLVPSPSSPPSDTSLSRLSIPTVTNVPSPSRSTSTTSTTTSSHTTSFTSGTAPYYDSFLPTAVAITTGPSYPDIDSGEALTTDNGPTRNDSVSSVVNGAAVGLSVLVIVAIILLVVLRRRSKNLNRVRQGLDFEGVGAYPGNGENSMKQKKTEHHVGLSSFGSASSSSTIGSVESSGSGLSSTTTAMTAVKKPAAAMVVKKQTAATAAVEKPVLMTQFWNP